MGSAADGESVCVKSFVYSFLYENVRTPYELYMCDVLGTGSPVCVCDIVH